MCTAICDHGKYFLFGRTLDLEYSYGEQIVLTPRKFKLNFLHAPSNTNHSAILGIGIIRDGYPLYYDAINEHGLAIAALNFPQSTLYRETAENTLNLASFEIIPYLLSNCGSIASVKEVVEKINITRDCVSSNLPASPLHWLIADKSGALTLESTVNGVNVYENPFGVLTNEPPFPYHVAYISNFLNLSSTQPQNTIYPSAKIPICSNGIGAFGLPGDFSSASRFVRAAFTKSHTAYEDGEDSYVSRFFHIMNTVSQPLGCTKTSDEKPISSVYTSCGCPETMTYYYSSYSCRRIRALKAEGSMLQSNKLLAIKIDSTEDILYLSP